MRVNKKIVLGWLTSFVLLSLIYFILYKLYIPRIMEFGCFDDCHTIATGYFISKGREIYSEIFYNHQLIFPYLSSAIQTITQPQNIYEIILRHRQTILILSFIFNFTFILRFGKIGFLFVILFEFSKFYFFGDRFLPEAIVVYPATYMTFLVLNKFNAVKPKKIDYFISGLFSFLIIFSREPYAPLAIILFVLILLDQENLREKLISIGAFIFLSLTVLLSLDIKEFIYIFATFNPQAVITSEIAQGQTGGVGILKLIFYPVYLIFSGENTFLRVYLTGLSLALITSSLFYLKQKRNTKLFLLSFAILALTCIRFVSPGQLFFESYRLNVWYGVLLISILFYLSNLGKSISLKKLMYHRLMHDTSQQIFFFSLILLLISFAYLSLNKQSFLLQKADPHASLLTNYGRIHQIGETLKKVSDEGDSLFADGAEEILYPISTLSSNYKYSLYASQMPMFEKYTNSRAEMFEKNPPDFYYDFCKDAKIPTYRLEEKYKANYIQLKEDGNPSCLFVSRSKLNEIPEEKLKKLSEFRFSL